VSSRPGESPIFVVGAPRSGNTLLQHVLNEHPELWIAGETHWFDDLRTRLPAGGSVPLDADWARRCEDYFLALDHRPYGHGGDPDASMLGRAELREAAFALGGTGDAWFEAYCSLAAQRHGRGRWGEKTPRHVLRLDDILGAYPGAQAVCVVRDPRAVVCSYRDWAPARAHLPAERRRIERSYNPALLAAMWRGMLGAATAAQRRYGGRRVLLLRYEDLVADPERVLGDLLHRLGLPPFGRAVTPALVNSSYARSRSSTGYSAAPVQRWRSRLTPAEIFVTERVAGHRTMRAGGYQPIAPRPTPRGALAFARIPVAALRALHANRDRREPALPYLLRRSRHVLVARRSPLGR
jgi:hypothetical protein